MDQSLPNTGNSTHSAGIGAAKNYTAWVVSLIRPSMGQEVLEVGLGEGNYAPFFPPMTRYVGVDIDAPTVDVLRRCAPERDYRVGDVTAPDFRQVVGERLFDTVVCCNVIEHVEDDRLAVENLLSCLRPGGRLFLFVPAFEALFNDMDRLAGHLRRYTRARLSAALPGAGITVLRLDYFNPVGGAAWWVQKFSKVDDLNGADIQWKIKLFDRWILPVSRVLDPLSRRVFGQSVYAIIEKEEETVGNQT